MKKVIFRNSLGQKLVGNLYDLGKDYIVIHCHGYGANKDSETATALQQGLAEQDISSLAFDFSDSGESEPKKGDLTVSLGMDELKCAIEYLKNLGFQNFALSGSSFGGSVVLNHAAEDRTIKAIALKAPVSDYSSINVSRGSKLRTREFIEDVQQYNVYETAFQIKCPVLIFHGDQDEIVPIEQSKKTCSLIKSCRLEIIKGADHQLADHDDRIKLIDDFVNFFKEHKDD